MEEGAPSPRPSRCSCSCRRRRPAQRRLRASLRISRPRPRPLLPTCATKGFASFAESRYGAAGAPALATLRAAGANFEELIVDPGTALHVDTFRAFLEHRPELKTGDAWAARQAFSDVLGTRTVYRALALTPDGFAKLQAGLPENGIGSKLLRTPEQASAERTRTEPLQTQLDDHVNGEARHGEPIVSVSEKPRVAASVAGAIARAGAPGKGYGVYLFTHKVPNIDLLAEHPGSPVLEQAGSSRPRDLVEGCRGTRPHDDAGLPDVEDRELRPLWARRQRGHESAAGPARARGQVLVPEASCVTLSRRRCASCG